MNKILMSTAFAASLLASSAQAGVHIGIALPGVEVTTDPCTAPAPPYPEYCGYPVYDEPVYIGGVWYRHPLHYRFIDGHREFFVEKAWRREDVIRDKDEDMHRR